MQKNGDKLGEECVGTLQWIKVVIMPKSKKDTCLLSLERVCVISPHIDRDVVGWWLADNLYYSIVFIMNLYVL